MHVPHLTCVLEKNCFGVVTKKAAVWISVVTAVQTVDDLESIVALKAIVFLVFC